MIESKQIHCGQYKRYGDFFRIWTVQTDLSKNEAIEWCLQNLYKRTIPPSEEWHLNIRYGGTRYDDAGYYFAGYYSMEEIDGGFKFTVCEPFAD